PPSRCAATPLRQPDTAAPENSTTRSARHRGDEVGSVPERTIGDPAPRTQEPAPRAVSDPYPQLLRSVSLWTAVQYRWHRSEQCRMGLSALSRGLRIA